MLKGICHATICNAITVDDVSLSDVITDPEEETSTETDHDQEVPSEVLQGMALTSQDWHKAQSSDSNISVLIDSIIEGKRPSSKDISQLDKRFLLAWDNLRLKDGILYKKATINGEDLEQYVLPTTLVETVFKAYHDDLGHQGRDRTTSLIRRCFFWPGMMDDIKQRVRLCGRCIRRKTAPTKAAELVNNTSSAPMELVCIDFLSLESPKEATRTS